MDQSLEWTGKTGCGMRRFAKPPHDEACVPSNGRRWRVRSGKPVNWTVGVVTNTLLFQPLGFERGFDEWIKVGWLDASRPKPGRFKSYRRRGEERISLVDPEADRRLEALGYLEPTRPSPIAPWT